MTTFTNIPKQAFELVESLKKENENLQQQVKQLNEQLAWFKKQIFGKRSEKIISPNSQELLFPGFEIPPAEEKKKKTFLLINALLTKTILLILPFQKIFRLNEPLLI